jgi:hypothetical protein
MPQEVQRRAKSVARATADRDHSAAGRRDRVQRHAQRTGGPAPAEDEVDSVVTLRLLVEDHLVLTVTDPVVVACMLKAEQQRRRETREGAA